MSYTLRPYQVEAVEAIEREWAQNRRATLLVLATGLGKTVVFTEVARREVQRGGRVLVLAHRAELLDQARDKISSITGLACALEKAEQTSEGSFAPIVLGSVQSMGTAKRLERFSSDAFDLIIVDEAHHSCSASYLKILDHFSEARLLGVTATPDRGDEKSLAEVFDSIAYEFSIVQGIQAGYLCPIEAQTIPLQVDIKGVGVSAGDFKPNDLGNALDPYLDAIAEQLASVCKDRKTVVFLPLIATAQKLCKLAQDKGMRAAEVNGQSKDRAEILEKFAAGELDILMNSMLLTEGWDCPSVDCIVVLRPTKVRSLYAQILGRGTRLSPETGKRKLLVIDFLWLTSRHQLCRPAALFAKSDEVAAKMTQTLEDKAGQSLDLEELEKTAEADTIKDREESLAKELKRQRAKKGRLVDPLQFEMSIAAADLCDWQPQFGWEMAPATEKQLHALEAQGIAADGIHCAGYASELLKRLHARQEAKMTTPKQIRFLEQRGFARVGSWQKDEASELIKQISQNRWQVPYWIDAKSYLPKSLQPKTEVAQ